MSKFNKWEFIQVVDNIEKQELRDEDIWISVGILEYMYDDDNGGIDEYFNTPFNDRDVYNLWEKINPD